MFKPLTQLNYFFRLATDRKLSGSDQLMYLHIFNKFNQAHWTETLRIKDAELKDLLRLYDSKGKPASIEIVRRGRQRLKAKGFIDFSSGDGHEPEYRLPCLYPADTPDDSPEDAPADSQASSYIRVREDVKTLRQNQSIACEKVKELDALLDYWSKLGGGRLSFEHQSKLSALLKEHGAAWVKAAMQEAADANNNPRGLSPKFLFSVIARKDKAAAPEKPAPEESLPLNDYEALRQKLLGGD